MEETAYAEGEETEKESYDDEDVDEFMKSYDEDEKVEECAECGRSVKEEKRVVKEVEGEEYVFCSESCAREFEESLKKE